MGCLVGDPCPAGSLALDNYCYQLFRETTSLVQASEACTALKEGSMLAPVADMKTWMILSRCAE